MLTMSPFINFIFQQTMESEIPDATESIYKPPNNWPHLGAVRFNNVQMQYQSHFPFVIQNISFDVKPKEKIGRLSSIVHQQWAGSD